jgi:hypothetical protein
LRSGLTIWSVVGPLVHEFKQAADALEGKSEAAAQYEQTKKPAD